MKCATSTLATQLAAQDGIFISNPKEPNFFSDDTIFNQGTDWYASLFEDAAPSDIVGEASTHYTKLPTHTKTIERFCSLLSDVKLVYVMRHPIDRLVSQYMHEWTQGVVTGSIDDELENNPWMIEYGRYAMQLTPWLEAFGADKILPVFNERMRSSPQLELERVCKFLGYQGAPVWLDAGDQNVSAQRLKKNTLRDAVLNAPVLKQLRKGFVPQSVRDWAKGFWQMSSRPEMSDATLKRLESVYNEDLMQLGSLLGHGITCANFKSIVESTPMTFVHSKERV
jgi:hypothetical protein